MYTFKSVVVMMTLSAVGLGVPLQQRNADALPQIVPPPAGFGPYGLKSLTAPISQVPEPTLTGDPVSVPNEPTAAPVVETTAAPAVAPLETSVAAPLETSVAVPTTTVASVQPTSVATTLSTAKIAVTSGSPSPSAATPSSTTTAGSNNLDVGRLVSNLLGGLLGGHR